MGFLCAFIGHFKHMYVFPVDNRTSVCYNKKNICSVVIYMRTILHSDLNNCFASIESISHPEYREIPFAVGGDEELRHGIILAKK